MNALTRWVRARKATASALVVAVIAGVPLTIAALHPGFPVSDVDLTSRDVWVTNGELLLGGRLNRQIDELNGSVVASTPSFEVLQDGDTLFMVDPDAGRVESVNPASTTVTSAIDVPPRSEVSYGGDVLAIVSPEGQLWAISAVGDLQFNFVSTPPLVELGDGGRATVTREGTVIAVSGESGTLYRIESLVDRPIEKPFPSVGAFQLAAVGEQAVVLDQSTNEVLNEAGSRFALGEDRGLRLQQTGPDSRHAVVATGDALAKVDLGSGTIEWIPANVDGTTTDPDAVAAPVNQDGCAHGAWADSQRYLLACDGLQSQVQDIEQPTRGSRLEFRVNRSVIALNDLSNGNVWLMDENMRLVENWDDVIPPVEEESEEEGEEESAIQSFEDTLAERTEQNRPPTAQDDVFGIRPGRTTILSLLDNDSDPDGDVLVISGFDRIAESTGVLDPIDGGRALQFTPAAGFVGTIAFNYTVDDGRGGTDTASVQARVVPDGINEAPYSVRGPGVSVEANQTVTYNVLADWRDPDGDDLYLVAASPKSGDLVRFTPDGFITFTHQTSELGEKEVVFTVSDGSQSTGQGSLTVKVEPAGSLNPVGTPDFATVFVGETVVVEPLANDLSPSGAQLSLVGLDDPGGNAVVSYNPDRGAVTFTASAPGVYYMTYTLQAGANTSVGIIRVDVREHPADVTLPPVAVKDTAYLRGEEPVTVSVLSNDVSPTGRIIAVQSVDVPPEVTVRGLVVELLESTLIRVTSSAALTEQVNFTYTISDGTSTATAGVTVVPVPALTKHQPPVAQNDAATVRVGDIITLDVLDNDFHPDDSSMFLDQRLITEPSDGLAFVAKDRLRFQAPNTPGEYRVDYRVLDPFGETAAATAVFTVTPLNPDGNRDPVPNPLIGRVLAGGSIRIDLPLSGIDPDGDSTQLLAELIDVPEGIDAEVVDKRFLVITAPETEQSFSLRYELTNDRGGSSITYVLVQVTPEAPLLPPSAEDVPIQAKQIAGEKSITVDLFDGYAFNPAGRTEDLVVTIEGPNRGAADLLETAGLVEVTPGETRQAIAYRVTNEADELSAMAFILVPAAVGEDFDQPPYIDPSLPPQYVSMNGQREWKLSDILIVPSGRDAHIYERDSVSVVQGAGGYVDAGTISITPPADYRGPAAINFTVSDGDSRDDPKGVTAGLTLNVIVGDPEFRDTPPEFTTPNTQVEVGETTVIDLRSSTAHPNPQILQQVTYSDIRPSGNALGASLNGSQLSLTVPRNTPKGSTYTVDVTLRWDRFTVQGVVNVLVVGSTRPLPVAVTDNYETKRPVGTFTMSPLVNDSNPYQTTGEPLRIVGARITNAGTVGTVSFTEDQISVTPVSTPQYLVIEVAYTIADATQDEDRQVNGLINFTITDVPMPVNKPERDGGSQYGGDRSATIRFGAPGTNGKEITGYQVRTVQTGTVASHCSAGAACTLTGLSNGTPYTFEVRAVNENGAGPWSPASDQITPYGKPATPQPTITVVDQWGPGGVIRGSWPAVAGTGGMTTYYWTASNGASGTTTGTSTPDIGGLGGGSYTLSVFAANDAAAGAPNTPYSSGVGTSAPAVITNQATPATPTFTGTSPANGSHSPATVSWTWGAVTANPGGSANLSYEIRYNGGGWQNVGTATSHTLSGRGSGNHTLEVRATNKAGPGGASSATVSLVQPPDPPRVWMCMTGSAPIGNYFRINWSGQSSGYHTVGVRNQAGTMTNSGGASGSSNGFTTQGYAARNTAGDMAAQYRYLFDGTLGPWTRMGDIPMC